MRLCTIFDNLGPYHIARLNAAKKLTDLLSLEYSSTSAEYPWLRNEATIDFKNQSLFQSVTRGQVTSAEMKTALRQVFQEHRVEVVSIPGWSSRLSMAAYCVAYELRLPVVLMSESTPHDAKRIWAREFLKRIYVSSCSAGFVGGEIHKQYLQDLGLAADRIFLGYDAVDVEYFNNSVTLHKTHAANSEPTSLPTEFFLASARFIAKKNLGTLLDAYASFLRRFDTSETRASAWSLVILGDGVLRSSLESQIIELGLRDKVLMPGFKQYEELPFYFANARAFVHVSSSEQWGLVVNEAMASGLPIIVSQQCGAAEIVDSKSNGFIVDAYSIESIATALWSMSTKSTIERESMGAASLRLARAWGPERFATGLRDACQCAIANSVRPSYMAKCVATTIGRCIK